MAAASPDDVLHETSLPTSSVRVIGSMPRGVTSFGAAVHRGWLYTLGGYYGTPHVYDRDHQSPSFRRMNLLDGSWQELPSPGSLQSVALVSHGDYVYRIGGMTIRNAEGEPSDLWSVDDFARFDPLAQEWYALPPLPAARSSHMATVIGDDLFVAGGWKLGGDDEGGGGDEAWHGTLLSYDLSADPTEGAWLEIQAPLHRRALSVAGHDGRVYVLGGMDRDKGVSRRVDVYDPRSGAWSEAPAFPEKGFGMAAVSGPDGLYASASSGKVYRLSSTTGWELVTSTLFPRFFHQWVAADDQLLLVGGIGRSSRVSHIESLSLTPRTGPLLFHRRVPAPGPVTSGPGAFVKEDSLYLFSGQDGESETGGYKLDLADLTWSSISGLHRSPHAPRATLSEDSKHAVVVSEGRNGEAARTALYDLKYDIWSEGPSELPASFRGFTVLPGQDGDVWVMGGQTDDEVQGAVWRAFVRDEALHVQDSGISLPVPRSRFATARLDGRVYVVGGAGADGSRIHACDVYDEARATWTQVAGPAAQRADAALVALTGKLYLAGGELQDAKGEPIDRNPLEVFDPESGEWRVLVEDLPLSATNLRMFAFRDRLLLVSTANGKGHLDLLWVDVGERRIAERTSIHG